MIYALCVLGAALALAGDFTIKLWATSHRLVHLAAGVAFYAACAFVWAAIVKRGGSLSNGAVLWNAIAFIGCFALGTLVFREAPTARQYVGAALVLAGIIVSEVSS